MNGIPVESSDPTPRSPWWLQVVGDRGEDVGDLATQRLEDDDRRHCDERENQRVLDERLTLFARKTCPQVREKHVLSSIPPPGGPAIALTDTFDLSRRPPP